MPQKTTAAPEPARTDGGHYHGKYACGRYAEALAQLDKFPTHGAHRGMLAAWRKSIEEKMAQ